MAAEAPMRRLFQSIIGASAAIVLRSNKSQQTAAIEICDAHPLRGPAGGRRIEAQQHLSNLQQRLCEGNVNPADLCENRQGQEPVAEVLLIIAVDRKSVV